jgi:single-strand DNA-binding protein
MNDLNRATIMGNLTRDPELRQTPNGRPVCSFGVATNRRWTDRATNEPKDEVEFHDVVAWGPLAEICSKILYKGRKAYIEGRLQTHTWEGQDGVKRSKTEIIADNVIAVGAPREGGTTPGQGVDTEPASDFDQRPASEKPKASATPKPSQKSEAEEKPSAPTSKKKEDEEEIDLDDIPF